MVIRVVSTLNRTFHLVYILDHLENGKFQCIDGSYIPIHYKCDGYPDCATEGEDESIHVCSGEEGNLCTRYAREFANLPVIPSPYI